MDAGVCAGSWQSHGANFGWTRRMGADELTELAGVLKKTFKFLTFYQKWIADFPSDSSNQPKTN